MTQQEFDDLPGVVVHLTTDDGRFYLCSGESVPDEPTPLFGPVPGTGRFYPDLTLNRPNEARKQCQACYYAARRSSHGA